jgi:hypothetical protein
MKNIFQKSIWVSSVFLLMFIANSCLENTDLVTENAKTGGLVNPVISNFPYKLGATPTFDVQLIVPKGPGIKSVKVMNSYTDQVAEEVSNEVVMKTIDVASANTAKELTKTLTLAYADLTSGLTLAGAAMPADELTLNIGDFWTIRYISVLADGREIVNNLTTTVAVANAYAGSYQCVGIFHHPTAGDRPINREKFLTPVTATKCYTELGDLGASGYDIYIDVQSDNTVVVTTGPNAVTDVFMTAGEVNAYIPADKSFNLHYYYVGGTGNRVVEEIYTPL